MIRLVFDILVILATFRFPAIESRSHRNVATSGIELSALNCRKHSALLTDFGGVGDGKTSNTKAFTNAISKLSQMASDGGAQLVVPPGKWLTGSFNLTSHFTLFIQQGATILASQDESEWPVIGPLPSYGKGRDGTGTGRFNSLISGSNLTDVVITGNNGTINGQGQYWWDKFKKKQFNVTRPYLIELLFSKNIQISNITLIDSPSWNIHPVYCNNVIVKSVTVLAPVTVPNTDGINPVRFLHKHTDRGLLHSLRRRLHRREKRLGPIRNQFGMPTKHLSIRRLTCISPKSAGVALGSEMSGGIKDVRIEDVTLINTESAIRVKTAAGRGAYVKDIFARRFTMKTMKYVFWMNGNYDSHPDEGYDPKALPEVSNINFRDMTAENVTMSASLDGIEKDPFTGVCISNVTIDLSAKPKKLQWNCTNVAGVTSRVKPEPCSLLPEKNADCMFPSDLIPIESVVLKKCTL
ncbi:hypothetical protein EUTSA_v10011050mg [Eutrema salsugineum]|uniref:Pectate lyase superfamily protein domain-containing protein n=1 Tax=Eutrema salsugineum TaxID=72664 RepID=V4NHI9_EUTSA|nr:hypothetical protein EUTSA_v10011050mg [Eutrema salsugineum]